MTCKLNYKLLCLLEAIYLSANNADTSVKEIEIVANIWLIKASEMFKQSSEKNP